MSISFTPYQRNAYERLLERAREKPLADVRLARQWFLKVPWPVRNQVIFQLIDESNLLGERLVMTSNARLLRNLSPLERKGLWVPILQRYRLGALGNRLVPTQQKAEDLLEAVLTMPPDQLFQPPAVYAAHLMSYLKWHDIPARFKEHDLFRGLVWEKIPQSVLSLIRDRQGKRSEKASNEICENMEKLFVSAMNWGETVTLVNNHMLFVDTEEWSLALCLRGFISPSGDVFLKGMYYFCSARQQILKARAERLTLENVIWRPARLCQPANYQPESGPKFDLEEFAARYPAAFAIGGISPLCGNNV